MASNSRSKQKRKIEPITYDELIGAAGMSGFVSFLNIPPDDNLASDDRLAPTDKLAPDDSQNVTTARVPLGSPPIASSDDNLASANRLSTDDALSSGVSMTPDAMASTPSYVRLDGTPVDARRVREYHMAQEAHTSSEHLVYVTLWRHAGGGDPDRVPYRDVTMGLTTMSRMASVSRRNLIRVLQSLEEKFAIEVVKREISSTQEAKTYRVWSSKALLERRWERGFRWVYRSRNLVELVRLENGVAPDGIMASGDSLTPGVS